MDETLVDITKFYSTQHDAQKEILGNKRLTDHQKEHEKRIDYITIKRRHLKYRKDAEANDMIHMGSDHRCVMATFTITTPKNDGHRKKKTSSRQTKHDRRDQTEKKKTLVTRSLSSKKDTKRSLKKSRKS